MKTALILICCAGLEVGGDALFRWGLKGQRWPGLALGALALFSYGLLVNLSDLDFGRLMGLYIVVFFMVAQAVSVLGFHEELRLPTLVGGALIASGAWVILKF